eukprot:GFUD01043735.1.p1 GENE.GFUD01043735.1~~GFUD01043735.1.p1  ORF type:complete len:381 (-),score=53.81 GFUD01043735.1:120-1145(-)
MDIYIRAQNLKRKIESMSGDVERNMAMVLINVLSYSLFLVMAELIKTQEMDISQLAAIHITGLNPKCNASAVNLTESPQWQQEEGYWIGEYSLYGSDGDAFTSSSWNYPYNHYKGFITGNVQGNAYRQRNVFMYPPQEAAKCPGSTPVGNGTCGTNGNMKIFEADQLVTTCSTNPELKGDIEGPYGSLSYTYTELVGKDNSLLYQVWLTKDSLNFYEAVILGNPYGRCVDGDCGYTDDRLMQSQLTTLTKLLDGTWIRTRTAQGFDAFGNVGAPTYASYYRETRVSEEFFWTEFNATMTTYNVLESDTCAWKSSESGGTATTGLEPGFVSCKMHLDSSFEL